jgi:hypothetical protein
MGAVELSGQRRQFGFDSQGGVGMVGPAHARGDDRAHLLRQPILDISDLVMP